MRSLLILSLILVGGCSTSEPKRAAPLKPAVAMPGVPEIERAHGIEAWKAHDAFRCELVVENDGKKTVDGILTFSTDGRYARLDLKGGTQLVFDGGRAWVSPDSAKFDRARYHLRNWPFFIAMPFRLRDAGVRIGWMGDLPLDDGGRHYPTLRLTFDSSAQVDAPRDWYLLYRDGETNRIRAMAYIVTYGKAPSDRPDDPQAVTFDDFISIDGVTLPTRWTFYDWVPGKGISGDPIGRATLKNCHFTTVPPGFFARPAGSSREDAPPAPK